MSDWQELGSAGLRQSGGVLDEERLPLLRGSRGRAFFAEMADNSPIASAIIFAFTQVVTNLDWRVDPAPADTPADRATAARYAEFVDSCLHGMESSWDETLTDVCSMFTFGWSLHEIVLARRDGVGMEAGDGRIGWRKWAPRAQETLARWRFDPATGALVGMEQSDPYGSRGPVFIPAERFLLFRVGQRNNSPEGRSLLRSGAPSWFLQKRLQEIEAVGVERDLAGLPVAYVPQEWLQSDASAAEVAALAAVQGIVTGVKRNEQEGIILPAVVDPDQGRSTPVVRFELMSSGGSRAFNTGEIISRYEQRIAMSVLMDFLLLGHDAVGSRALATPKMELWSMAVDSVARSITDVINKRAVVPLLRVNGMYASLAPRLVYGRVGAVDVEALTGSVHRLVQAGAILPDAGLESAMREALDLPPREAPE